MSFWINNIPVTWDVYPNNESLVRLTRPAVRNDTYAHWSRGNMRIGDPIDILKGGEEIVTIRWHWQNDMDFIRLKFMVDHIRYGIGGSCKLYLDIDYMPYSRMDRSPDRQRDIFTLKYAADFINSLKFDAVRVIEPHSDATLALLNHAKALSPLPWLVARLWSFVHAPIFIIPDAGAEKRYGTMLKGEKVYVGQKQRDFATGKINSIILPELPLAMTQHAPNGTFVIVDDLCSRGGTFDGLVKDIRHKGYLTQSIYLCVAHCEDTVFGGPLLDGPITKMITTDSMSRDLSRTIATEKLTDIFNDYGKRTA